MRRNNQKHGIRFRTRNRTQSRTCCWLQRSPILRLYFIHQVLIVMTDGISQDSVVRPSSDLRNAGVSILALGIGKRFRRSQLNQMAGNRRYVFSADFRSLTRVVRSIKRAACRGEY